MQQELNREFFVKTGREGARALIKKRGKKYMSLLAKKGAAARWRNHKKQIKK